MAGESGGVTIGRVAWQTTAGEDGECMGRWRMGKMRGVSNWARLENEWSIALQRARAWLLERATRN